MVPSQIKYCFVRECTNNSRNSNKFFITVPRRPDKRIKWYHAVNIRDASPSRTCNLYCCEDHFDLENDIANWIYFKMMGRKVILKKGVVPHIFPIKKDESTSQFTEEAKAMKRKILQDFQNARFDNEHLTSRYSNYSFEKFKEERYPSSNYSVETSVVDVDKNVLVNVKDNDNIKSQFLVNSMENKWQNTSTLSDPEPEPDPEPLSEEVTTIPTRVNIQIDPDLPELIWCKNRQGLREKHQPLLLRKKTQAQKIPEVIWINPTLVEISNKDELETGVKNSGTLENEEKDSDLPQIKTDTEFVEIKQEEIEMENITLEDNSANYVYFTTHDDILLQTASNPTITMEISPHSPKSFQSFLNLDSNPNDLTTLGIDSGNQITNIAVKEESVGETEDFEFVNVNIKSENSFFFDDPLKISGKSIYVAKQTDESILG